MNETKTLPAGEPTQGQTSSITPPPFRILMVDDDDDIRRLCTEVLIRSGYQVAAAEDGAIAWGVLQHNTFDLLVTDQSMPKVSGVELLQRLHNARKTLPVIMASGTLPEHEFALSPWLRPDATLLKPFTNDELVNAVKAVLLTQGSRRVSALQSASLPKSDIANCISNSTERLNNARKSA